MRNSRPGLTHHRLRAGRHLRILSVAWAPFCLVFSAAAFADMRQAQQLYRVGEYARCADVAGEEIDRGVRLEGWRHLKTKAELALGRHAAAMEAIEEGLEAYPFSIQMRLLAHTVFRLNGRQAMADAQLVSIEQLIRSRPRRYSSPEDRIALGEYLLSRGADARQILELCFDPVTKQRPEYVEGHLASAELALEKFDLGLAAEILSAAPTAAQDEPRFHFLRARAYANDDPRMADEALAKALEINPRHLESLLLKAEKLIDGERYEAAREVLTELRETNARHPLAWACEAVLANLSGDEQQESSAREAALSSWTNNPHVDHTIGRKLSDKYRFAEGAAYQRRALDMDADFLPARLQLAQDLLRLGQEDAGWQMIHDVFSTDGYNVIAHNLVTLHDSFENYRILANDAFRVRMEAREAEIYGERVLQVLSQAKQELCAKYDVTLDEPVIVEIFPHQKDFAVRTFGIPGADGFLGVCFGNVITANSPAALGETTANWEAVLWHEFCHVVTLHRSRNKMPRWLSEGISVYEELQKDSTWGQKMTPTYRQMILAGEMAPLSELSSAFLAPASPLHLQFAYYESAMAVAYIVENFGMEPLQAMLDDLAVGASINEALIRHVAPLGRLDTKFAAHMKSLAEQLAPGLSWEDMELPPTAGAEAIAAWLKDHPDNFQALVRLAQLLLRESKWQEALEPAGRLRELYPGFVDAGGCYALLARAYRGLNDVASEREVLEAWCQRDSDAADAYFRLMEIGEEAGDWQTVDVNAKRLLAVNPLGPLPHRYLARAAEALHQPGDATAAYRALLNFDTSDLVHANFRLAKLLHDQQRRDEARRHVLRALEDAPRFREAHRLLLELVAANESESPEDVPDAAGQVDDKAASAELGGETADPSVIEEEP